MRIHRLIAYVLIAAIAAGVPVLLALRGAAVPTPRRVEWPVMGTVAGLTFRGGDAVAQDTVRETVQRTYARLEGLLSAWDPDSELCRLARANDTNAFARASEEARPCYQAALDLAVASGNAFNPRVGARLRELGFSHGQHFCDFDLGAIAKGFAVDAACRALPANLPFAGLLVDLGGNLRAVLGTWRTGVRNPFGDGYAAVITLAEGESVATSGNYERFVERNGVRYSHILDGRTGEPVTGVAGVTVVTPAALGATLADGLSTTLFVLGPKEGARFLREHADAYGAAQALWIPDTPAHPEIQATPEMAARLADAAFPVRVVDAFQAAAATENPFVDVVPYAGRKRLDKSLVTRTDNPDGTIDFDFRPAFAAGADKVRLTSRPFPIKEYRGRDFALVGEWSGVLGKPAMLESRPSGPRADGTFWFSSCGANPLSAERRHNQCCAGIPNGLKKLYVNFDFTAPGEGLVRFYGYRHGHADILVSDAPDDDAPPRLLFTASFEDGAAAVTPSGKVEPLASAGLEFVPGRKGRAVKLSKTARSSLRYAAEGHIDWRRGTIAFWAKRAFGTTNPGLGIDGKSLYHPFFALPSDPAVKAHARGPQHGDASLWFSWTGQFLSFTRGDATLNRVIRGIPYLGRLGSRDWCHYVITWDAFGQRVYLDGKDVRGVPGDNANPYTRVSTMSDRLIFAPESHRKLGSFFIGSGPGGCVDGLIDEFRVYSAPMNADEVRRLYNADCGGQEKSFNGWINPWAAESPLPENAAILGGDADGRGVPEGMELFEEVSPAALAKSGDGSRFRSAGQWKTGVFDGLEYLETGKGMNDRYAIRFTVPSAVPLWVFEVTFPDDVARSADISVQNARTGTGNYSLNHGYETGIEHPHTRTNIVQRFLYWASDADREKPQTDLAFVVMSTWHDEPAAVSKVRLFSVKSGKLPDARIRDAAPVAGRRRSFAIRFEDPAVPYDLGGGQETLASARLEFDRLAAYMKFTGADTLMYPAVWYKGNINDNYMPRTHVSHYLKEICARFERDGLSFVPTVNQQWFIDFRDPKDVKSLYDGSLHATPITILDSGLPNMGGWHYSPTYYNISHPDVQRRLLEEFDQILDECAEFKSFKGVSIDLFNQINVMWWGSDRAGYNDYSIDMFRKAKHVDVPKFTGAFRGRDYAKWLRANAWEAWLDWRCDVVTDLYARFAARLAARRPDLTLYVAAYSRQRGRDGVAFRDDIDDPALVRKMLRECGIDGDRLARIPNLSLGIQSTSAFARDELRRDSTIPEDRKAKTRDLPETPGFYAEARKTKYPFALFSDSYYETAIGAPADGNGKYRGDGRLYGDWLKKEFSWRVSHINAAGREALRPFAKALKDGDMLCFAKGAFLISLNGMEDVLVPWMREFRKIPAVQFKDEKGNWPEAVKVRTAEVDGRRHAYVVNTGFEPVEVDLGRFGKLRLDSYELRYLR